ncbi:hypothetical protein FXF51_54000 [Nonomuraea sp. PA05]|uniref:hypothetical protein n=1 Tax=Nonomuraea sp. PA05 TaxID=2604466 RepID=UPI0011D771DB|nr:hypothetical protein [Nonomuraea sp. PA05]TYB51104.1 hypothetical protein FXF51_54000 [Nonomuraea sp. PA05]
MVTLAALLLAGTLAATNPAPSPAAAARQFSCGTSSGGLGIVATSTKDQAAACSTAAQVAHGWHQQVGPADGQVPFTVAVGGSAWDCQETVVDFGEVDGHGQCVKSGDPKETMKLFS